MKRWDRKTRTYVTGRAAWRVEISGWIDFALGAVGATIFITLYCLITNTLGGQ